MEDGEPTNKIKLDMHCNKSKGNNLMIELKLL